MSRLSTAKLAGTIKQKREKENLTQEGLGQRTGINRVIIGRIENSKFIPSIPQLEALAEALDFEIMDVFEEKKPNNSFVALLSETLNPKEKEGVETLFGMMLALRQQIVLRGIFEDETES